MTSNSTQRPVTGRHSLSDEFVPKKAREESLQSFTSLSRLGHDVLPYGRELPEIFEDRIEDLLSKLVFPLTPYRGADAARQLPRSKDGASRGGGTG